jgi:HD-GYP domain-containing protein (c-di-GMP phosphodiesterase class II)
MHLCQVKELKNGMILGKSIYHSDNTLLLGAGYRITPDIKEKLTDKGVTHIYIMDGTPDEVIPEDIISDELNIKARSQLSEKAKKIEETLKFQEITQEKALDLLESGHLKNIHFGHDIRKLIEEILKEIATIGVKFLNTILIKSNDTVFFDHAVNTTVLAIIVGRKYKFSKSDLISLALGTFLHDIGKVISNKVKEPGVIDSNHNLYREHPTFGYLLVKEDPEISPMESQIIHQHHEYQNGSGFPIGLTGLNLSPVNSTLRDTQGHISRLAEICCVVNAYDNLVCDSTRPALLSPQEALRDIIADSGTKYNKDIVQTLLQVIAVYPAGAFVKILNSIDPSHIGCYGVVAKVNENDFTKPVIILTNDKFKKKIKPIMIDTAKLSQVELKVMV